MACGFVIFGSIKYLSIFSNFNDGIKLYEYNLVVVAWDVLKLDSWVSWIMINAILHSIWVSMLLGCQTYQIIWLGMTTNERINAARYEHFIPNKKGYTSPYNRGKIQNLFDFLQCHCLNFRFLNEQAWFKYCDFHVFTERELDLLVEPDLEYV